MTAAMKPTPGDLDALRMSQLAEARQWSIIAAIASHSPAEYLETALSRLAPHCAEPEPFAWFWALLHNLERLSGPTPPWPLVNDLPETIAVPTAQSAAVTEFITNPEDAGASVPETARAGLLKRLPKPLRQRACRTVFERMAEGDGVADAVLWTAVELFVPTVTARDRELVLRAMERRGPAERLLAYLLLPGALSPDELTALETACDEHLRSVRVHDDVGVDAIQRAWVMLPLATQRRFVTDHLASRPEVRPIVFSPGFADRVGADAVLDMVLPNVDTLPGSDVTIEAGLAVLSDLVPNVDASNSAALLTGAHDTIPADRLNPVTRLVVDRLSTYLPGDDRRQVLLTSLVTCVVSKGAIAACEQVVGASYPGELPGATKKLDLADPTSARNLGTLLDQFVTRARGLPDQAADDATAARQRDVIAVLDQRRSNAINGEVFTGVVEAQADLPGYLCEYAAAHTSLITRVVDSGRAYAYVAWLEAHSADEQTDVATTRMLLELIRASTDLATAERAATLLTARLAERTASWDRKQSLDNALVAALGNHPDLLCHITEQQVDSLGGPSANAAPPVRLGVLIPAALDAGLAQQATHAVDSIGLLVGGAKALHPLAAAWLDQCQPKSHFVTLCVKADTDYATHPSPYGRVLSNYAHTLSATASDATNDIGDRISALELAGQADQEIARTAALTILGNSDHSEPVDLRRAAAAVVAESQGHIDEVDTLTALAEAESDSRTRDDLLRALRRISSGDIGEALRNLITLVGSDTDPSSVTVAVVLPYPRWHETFMKLVDDTRSAANGPPKQMLNELCSLAEHLVELAVIRHQLGGATKKVDEAKLILDNDKAKPDVGTLVERQELISRFKWFASVSSLRQYRDTHPAKSGTTLPVHVDDQDVQFGLRLMSQIVDGWLTDMGKMAGK